MTVTLELTDDVEQAIERKARKLGITPSEYLMRMAQRAAHPSKSKKRFLMQINSKRVLKLSLS